jgi:hypothetical protein
VSRRPHAALVPRIGVAVGSLLLALTPVAAQNEYRLAVSSYLGGGRSEQIRDVAFDAEGNLYLAGGTASTGFPTTPGAYDRSHNGSHDVFVTKVDPRGNLIWSTLIGGSNYDRAYAIEVDGQGDVYVAGRAGVGYPTTSGVVQPAFGGDVVGSGAYGRQDGFVTKLSADGSRLIWSTFFGSDDREVIRDIAIDGQRRVVLGVTKLSRDHPHITAGAFQPTRVGFDGVIAKLSADASNVIFASYFGGSATDGDTPSVRVDASGNIYYLTDTESDDAPATPGAWRTFRAGGRDMILSKLSPSGSLLWSTYVGGSGNEFSETHGLALDASGNAYVAATTVSTDVPTTSGAFQPGYAGSGGSGTGAQSNYNGDGFIARISASGANLMACTYLGGSVGDGIEGVGVDGSGRVYVSGATYSSDFPTSADAIQPQSAGDSDFFVARLSADLRQLSYATFLGGTTGDTGRTAAVSPEGAIAVAGTSESVDWPLAAAPQPQKGGGWDAVFSRLSAPTGCDLLDADRDGAINGIELSWIGRAFGSCSANPSSEWWAPVDYDGDGCVDGNDLAILSRDSVWGRSVAECVYP